MLNSNATQVRIFFTFKISPFVRAVIYDCVLRMGLSTCSFDQEWISVNSFPFFAATSTLKDFIQLPWYLLKLHKFPRPFPSLLQSQQGKSHIRNICRCFAWPPLQLTFKTWHRLPSMATDAPCGISDNMLTFFKIIA